MMKRLLFSVLATLALASSAFAACIPSGVTDQYIYFVAVDSTDFTTRETGLSTFTVYRSRDGAAAAAFTTPTVNETDATNMPGVYELLLDEDMTIGSGNDVEEMAFHITATGMAAVTRTIELCRPKFTAGSTLALADINTEVDTALTDIHLDHLLAADYDPAAKPGTGTALLNELVESDAGVSRYTANALEQGPGGASSGMTPLFSGTMQSGSTSTTAVLASATTIPDDNPNFDVQICIHTGTGLGQCRLVEDWVSSTDTATVSRPWTTTPDNTSEYEGWPAGAHINAWSTDIASVEAGIETSADIADAVLDEACTGHTTAGTAGEQICSDIDAVLADTAELQTDWTNGGRLDLIIDAILTDTGTTLEASIAAVQTVVDLLQSGIILKSSTCDSGTTTTCVDATLIEANDYWKGAAIVFTSGSIAGETSCVYDFVAASDTLTFRARTAAVSTNTYLLVESATCEGVVP